VQPLADDAGALIAIGRPALREAEFTTSSLSMPSASWMILAARSPSSHAIASSSRLVMGYTSLMGANCYTEKLAPELAPDSAESGVT
jgi:hypothetical protein